MYYDRGATSRPAGVDSIIALASTVPLLPPGGFGTVDAPTVAFYNVPPRSRAERKALADRETVEKQRLRERKGAHFQYADPGRLVAPDDPHSALYMGSKERFTIDTATEVRMEKEDRLRRKATELLRRREEVIARDEDRWQKMESEARAAEARVAALQADGGKARRNQSGMPFDPVTLSYHATHEGESLRWVAGHKKEGEIRHGQRPFPLQSTRRRDAVPRRPPDADAADEGARRRLQRAHGCVRPDSQLERTLSTR